MQLDLLDVFNYPKTVDTIKTSKYIKKKGMGEFKSHKKQLKFASRRSLSANNKNKRWKSAEKLQFHENSNKKEGESINKFMKNRRKVKEKIKKEIEFRKAQKGI